MIKKNSSKFRLLRFLLVICVSFSLIFSLNLPAVAQFFPNFGNGEANINSSTNIPIFEHGNLEIAPVFLDGKQVGVIKVVEPNRFNSSNMVY